MPARDERSGRSGSGRAGLIADKGTPVGGQSLAKLADAAGAHAELSSRGFRRFALSEELGDAAITAFERSEPVAEIQLRLHDRGGVGVPRNYLWEQRALAVPPINGCWRYLLAVRDLASGYELA